MTNEERKTLDRMLAVATDEKNTEAMKNLLKMLVDMKPGELGYVASGSGPMPDDLKKVVAETVARQAADPTNVRRKICVNEALSALKPGEDLEELRQTISGDMKKTYGVDSDPDDSHRIAKSVYLMNALAEEIRQLGHKIAPMYGGNLALKATRVAGNVVQSFESEVGMAILRHGLENNEVEVVGISTDEKGGDDDVG